MYITSNLEADRLRQQKTTLGGPPVSEGKEIESAVCADAANWTIEDCKNIGRSDESRVLLEHSDGPFRIWCKQHETLGSLVPVHHYLNATAYVSNAADHAHSFTDTECPSSDGCFEHKAQIISK